eukprot:scaffold25405_cov53-Phaeocystis_antarctica.AAC.3
MARTDALKRCSTPTGRGPCKAGSTAPVDSACRGLHHRPAPHRRSPNWRQRRGIVEDRRCHYPCDSSPP